MLWNYRGVARRGGAAAASSWSVVLLCYGAGMLKFRRREVTSASHSKMSLVILEGGRKTHTHLCLGGRWNRSFHSEGCCS